MRKRDIIDTSIVLFNEKGCLKTSTRHIADAMGISVGNLYYYFKNKEEILITILEEYFHQLLESLHQFDFTNNKKFLFKELLIHLPKLDQKYKFLHLEMNSIMFTFPKFKFAMRAIFDSKVNLEYKLIHHQIEHGYIIPLQKNEIEYLIANLRTIKLSSMGYWGIFFDTSQSNFHRASLNLFYFLPPYLTQKAYDHEEWHELEHILLKELHNV